MNYYSFYIQPNEFMAKGTRGYFGFDFVSATQSGKLHFLHILKNLKEDTSIVDLEDAKNKAKDVIVNFLIERLRLKNNRREIVCMIPRSKVDFQDNQQYFKKAVLEAIQETGYENGVDCIKRIKNVRTTHLHKQVYWFDNQGNEPYPGITKDTCKINYLQIKGRKIILIDDIYTLGANTDEDCIDALYGSGAKYVEFFALGRTEKNRNTKAEEVF